MYRYRPCINIGVSGPCAPEVAHQTKLPLSLSKAITSRCWWGVGCSAVINCSFRVKMSPSSAACCFPPTCSGPMQIRNQIQDRQKQWEQG